MTGKFPKVHREAGEMRFGLGFLPIEGTPRNLLNHVIVLRSRSPWQASQDRPLWGEIRMQISCGTEARSIGFHVRHSSSQKLESVRLQVTYQTPFLITFTLVYFWNGRQSGMEAPQFLPLTYLMEVYPKYGASWESTQSERATRPQAHRTAAILLITQKQLVPPYKPSFYSGEGHITWAWQPPPGPWNPSCMFQNLPLSLYLRYKTWEFSICVHWCFPRTDLVMAYYGHKTLHSLVKIEECKVYSFFKK